jgi:hypothetical protein
MCQVFSRKFVPITGYGGVQARLTSIARSHRSLPFSNTRAGHRHSAGKSARRPRPAACALTLHAAGGTSRGRAARGGLSCLGLAQPGGFHPERRRTAALRDGQRLHRPRATAAGDAFRRAGRHDRNHPTIGTRSVSPPSAPCGSPTTRAAGCTYQNEAAQKTRARKRKVDRNGLYRIGGSPRFEAELQRT